MEFNPWVEYFYNLHQYEHENVNNSAAELRKWVSTWEFGDFFKKVLEIILFLEFRMI